MTCILNLTIVNRNRYCTQIHLFTTRTMVFSPTKPILMKSSRFSFQPRLQVMPKFHGKMMKSRICRNGCDKKLLKKNGVPFLVPRKAPDFRKQVFGALHFIHCQKQCVCCSKDFAPRFSERRFQKQKFGNLA